MFRALQKQGMQIYAKWIALLGTLEEQAHFGLGILAGGYFLLIATTAIVATFHSEAERPSGCAQGVEATPAPPPSASVSHPEQRRQVQSDGAGQPPAHVASDRKTGRARQERHG
jgi:hypothetical protein